MTTDSPILTKPGLWLSEIPRYTDSEAGQRVQPDREQLKRLDEIEENNRMLIHASLPCCALRDWHRLALFFQAFHEGVQPLGRRGKAPTIEPRIGSDPVGGHPDHGTG